MKGKLKVGDTISLVLNERNLVSGIVYINSSIPMGKFYSKQFGAKTNEYTNDVYEDALVLIDNQNPGTLTVLTLEDGNNKLFRWNDVFEEGNMDYLTVKGVESIKVEFESSLLTEMTHSFK